MNVQNVNIIKSITQSFEYQKLFHWSFQWPEMHLIIFPYIEKFCLCYLFRYVLQRTNLFFSALIVLNDSIVSHWTRLNHSFSSSSSGFYFSKAIHSFVSIHCNNERKKNEPNELKQSWRFNLPRLKKRCLGWMQSFNRSKSFSFYSAFFSSLLKRKLLCFFLHSRFQSGFLLIGFISMDTGKYW